MNIKQTILPLRLIFWGGLLCVFDLTISETVSHSGRIISGIRFDFLNDFVGMLMITYGVNRLAHCRLALDYQRSMQFILICCLLNCLTALAWHFILQPIAIYSVLLGGLGLATLVSTVLFCNCMENLSIEYQLTKAALSWRKTRLLVILLWVIPLGILYLSGVYATISGEAFNLDLGVLTLPVLLGMVVPLVYLFVSTSRMQREATFR